MTEKEKKVAFLLRLNSLLSDFDATIECYNHYIGYTHHDEDVKAAVMFDGSGFLGSYQEIDLGQYITKESLNDKITQLKKEE